MKIDKGDKSWHCFGIRFNGKEYSNKQELDNPISVILNRFNRMIPGFNKFSLKNKDGEDVDLEADVSTLSEGCYFEQIGVKRVMKYSEQVKRILANFKCFYVCDEEESMSEVCDNRNMVAGIRRTLCISAISGIANAFVLENWDVIINTLLTRAKNSDMVYYEINIGFLQFRFNILENIDAYARPNLQMELVSHLKLPFEKTMTKSNLVYGDMINILVPFRYSVNGSPEEQYRSKVIVPLFTALFGESASYLGIPEYSLKHMNLKQTRNIDFCILPNISLPPLFIVECAGGDRFESYLDHKDYQRVYQVCVLIITSYMAIFKAYYKDDKCDDFVAKVNKLRVYGCMSCNLCFQFFVAYPELTLVDGQSVIHIVYQVPDAWRIDLTSDEPLPVDDMYIDGKYTGAPSMINKSKLCFEGGLESVAQLDAEIPEELLLEILEDRQDIGAENATKKQKQNCYHDLREQPDHFLDKLRFIKSFVDCAKHTIESLELRSMDIPAELPQPLPIYEGHGVAKSRKSFPGDTVDGKRKANQARDDSNSSPDRRTYETPTKSSLIRFNGRKYYCLVKDVGSSEIAVLKCLKLHNNPFICKLFHTMPGIANCDTCLYFEPLVSLKHLKIKTYGDFLNLSLNYIVNGLHALEFLESCQIYHRDISPNNIMLDTTNECFKLIDFGHAVFKYEHKETDRYGTDGFVDPARPWDRNDLYSFGKCVNYDIFNRMIMMDSDTPRSVEMLSIISKLRTNALEKAQLADLIKQGFTAFSRFKELYGFARSVHWIQ